MASTTGAGSTSPPPTETAKASETSSGGLGLPADVGIPTRVLVLGMAHRDGRIHAAELYPVAEACGQSSDQVRSCLRRLVSEGLFTRQGDGREATFVPTDLGQRALTTPLERARLAYLQDAKGQGWDHRWRLVAFGIPETKRTSRDAFRDRLLDLGGAAVQPGLYVSPHRWADDARAEADRLHVAEHVTVATAEELEVGGLGDPRELTAHLWPIDDLARRYQAFIDVYEGIPEELEQMRRDRRRLSEADFLPGALVIGIKFQECFATDPLLPPELLPRPWPGRKARELLARSRRLGVLLREEHDRPQLFGPLDEILAAFT